jgi:5'-nucleotidase
VTSVSVNNVIATRDVAADPDQTALIAKYSPIADPLRNRVIGTITADITRAQNPAGESSLGDLIADGQLDATSPAGFGEAVVAFQNPGGIRADLTFAPSGSEAPGEVTYGDAFAVQPFGNSLVTMTLTGAQIDTLLEQQFDNPTVGQMRILQVSRGFTYSWSASAPTGSKVSDIEIDGVPVLDSETYRVTVNSFMAEGGDNFFVFKDGTDRLGGALDLDALEAYFIANSPVAPGPQNRITQLP